MRPHLIGLDFGTLSARAVLLDGDSGRVLASRTHAYRHGVISQTLPDGTPLPPHWALQCASDYTEAAEALLSALGRGRLVQGIGLGFTASSPLPALADGTPLSARHPGEAHAYVKLWKHRAAQGHAEALNAMGGSGVRLSAEWLAPKAAQIQAEAPQLWQETARFIEGGDWLVWQLTGRECRSLGFAAYKAQYQSEQGYPAHGVPGLADKLAEPQPIGHSAGGLSAEWRARTGILGAAEVAVAVIDSHVLMPAVGATEAGTFVGALGTSAAFMLLADGMPRAPLPAGAEGVAWSAVLPGFWCYEAGQAGFGDTLDWFMRTFAPGEPLAAAFERLNREAAARTPERHRLLALDWWNGCRVPHGDSALSGLLLGLTLGTTAADIYRALLESLCLGTRSIIEGLEAGGAPVHRILLSSGLAQRHGLLMQLMADVLDRPIQVPEIDHATAVGAAIHGAVAAGLVADYAEGSRRFGARTFTHYLPRPESTASYRRLMPAYRALSHNPQIQQTMHLLFESS